MSRKNTGYQTIPDLNGANSAGNTTTDQHAPASFISTGPTQAAGAATGSGVPPKIINPTKQAFTQSHQLQSPIHSQIPGSANVTAKVNAAGSAGSPIGAGSTSTGSVRPGGPLNVSSSHNLSTTGGAVTSNAAINLRGKTKQPMRTTKTSQKLTLFPEEKDVPVLEDEYAFDDTTYNQIGQLSSSM